MISIDEPATAPATFNTAPTPVITAHPVIAATAGGTPSGIRTTDISDTTTCSARHDTPIRWCTVWPSSRRRDVPSLGSPPDSACTRPRSHSTG